MYYIYISLELAAFLIILPFTSFISCTLWTLRISHLYKFTDKINGEMNQIKYIHLSIRYTFILLQPQYGFCGLGYCFG